jgi:hypothetical protein
LPQLDLNKAAERRAPAALERRLSIFDARMQLEGHAIEASAASASLGAA